MATFNDKGIVLSSYNLGENDKIFSIYTRENGLVKAVAKGAKKQNSKFRGRLDLLSCCFFHFATGKNLETVCDLEQINSFSKIRKDLKKISYGVLFLEVVKNFSEKNESDSYLIYDLLYSNLENLQTSTNYELQLVKFLLEFLSIHGFKPQLDYCVSCNEEVASDQDLFYSSNLGGILCTKCTSTDSKKINQSVLQILYEIGLETTDYGVWFDENIEKNPIEKKEYGELNLRESLEILKEHLNTRAKSKINSFEMIFSL